MRLVALGLALASFLLAGCGDPGDAERPSPAQRTEIAIHGTDYHPNTVTMAEGGSLRFENHEAVAHTATATASPMGNLDSGDIAPNGGAYVFEDMKAGTYAFTCRHHAEMRLTVTVAAA